MKHYQYFGLLAAIWIAPKDYDWMNALFSILCAITSFYFLAKDE